MNNVTFKLDGDTLVIYLSGHIDSANAAAVEAAINDIRSQNPHSSIVFDCDKLEYISSAGLRVVLRVKKAVNDTSLINVSAEVYDIFDMTGFTEMMEIKKAYRVLSVEGCEVIGQGANGKVYRIDSDTIVKVYLNPDALPEIHRERELARAAFVLGVPTAIPYDVVRIQGGGYGSVFELLNASSFAKLLVSGEKTSDEIAAMSVELLKLIHSTVVKPGIMPDMKQTAVGWAEFLKDYLEAPQYEKLHRLITSVPDDDHMMHGDYHIKNVMLQNGESLLIDMDTLCHGHPVFELASMFNAYCGYSELDHGIVKDFLGIDYDTSRGLWLKMLSLYLGTNDEQVISSIEKKAQIVGYTRMMRRAIRRNALETEAGRATIAHYREKLAELLAGIDDLTFSAPAGK